MVFPPPGLWGIATLSSTILIQILNLYNILPLNVLLLIWGHNYCNLLGCQNVSSLCLQVRDKGPQSWAFKESTLGVESQLNGQEKATIGQPPLIQWEPFPIYQRALCLLAENVSEPVRLKAEAGPAHEGEDVINFRGLPRWLPDDQVMPVSPCASINARMPLDTAGPPLPCFAWGNSAVWPLREPPLSSSKKENWFVKHMFTFLHPGRFILSVSYTSRFQSQALHPATGNPEDCRTLYFFSFWHIQNVKMQGSHLFI